MIKDLAALPESELPSAFTKSVFAASSVTSSVTSGIIGSVTASPLYTIAANNGVTTFSSTPIVPNGRLSLKGEHADIDVNGKSFVGWMKKVEQRLNMLEPNPGMETEWEQLKQLGDQYRNLEKICEEKSMIWQKLAAVQPRLS